MARGTTLQQLMFALRNELFITTSPAVGDSFYEQHKHLIQRVQKRLYDNYDWAFMREYHPKTINTGQRYYDIPTNLNLERVENAFYKWDSQWIPVCRGINLDHYNVYDSELDQRGDPVQAWDAYGDRQFEIWPIPTVPGEMKFYGLRKLGELNKDSDRADLDDDLIVLFAAAEWLSKSPKDKELAGAKLQNAQAHLARLRGQLSDSRITPINGESSHSRGKVSEIRVAYVR